MTYNKEYYQKNKEKWREYGRRWRAKNPEKDKAKKAKYRATEKGKAKERAYSKKWREQNADKIRENARSYWAEHKERKAAKDKRYRERHKEELNAKAREKYKHDLSYRAHHAVRTMTNQAIKYGKISRQPCEVCGVEPAEAHHDDYNKPLGVRWLCKKCHTQWHNDNTPKHLTKC